MGHEKNKVELMIHKLCQLLIPLILLTACSTRNLEVSETRVLNLTGNLNGKLLLFEIGTITMGQQFVVALQLNNSMHEPVMIQEVRRFCGCTMTKYDAQPILPRESSEVKVVFVADHLGIFSKSVKVYLSSQKEPIELKLKGEVVQTSSLTQNTGS